MVKVSAKRYRDSQPAPPTVVKTDPGVNVTNVVDMKELKEPIDNLVQAVKDSQIPDNTENVIFAIKGAQGNSDKKQADFVK